MTERDQPRTADLSPDTPPEDRWTEDRGREQDDRPDQDAPRATMAPDDDLTTTREDELRATREPDVTATREDDVAATREDDVTATRDADAAGAVAAGPLLGANDAEAFRARWTDVQNSFVDAPRQAVEAADGLTAELMQHLAKTFADERSRLEQQWDRGDDVSTDELRTAFQRYRSFFERLLAA